MSIVAISETAGSLGREIGRTVAATLGHEFADREIISKAAERFGEGVLELTHATEEKPTLWERFTETQRRYMAYVEAIVLEMAARDNVILVGRASTIILGKIPHALRVRISAPERARAQQVHQQQGLTAVLADKAVADELKITDEQRTKIQTIVDDQRNAMRELFQGGGGGDRQAMMQKMQELRKQTDDKIAAVLTDDQKSKWKEMTGAPFTFPAPRFGNRGAA